MSEMACMCGSTDLCIAYRQLMFVYVAEGAVVRTIVPTVDDLEAALGGVVRCLICDCFWTVDDLSATLRSVS